MTFDEGIDISDDTDYLSVFKDFTVGQVNSPVFNLDAEAFLTDPNEDNLEDAFFRWDQPNFPTFELYLQRELCDGDVCCY